MVTRDLKILYYPKVVSSLDPGMHKNSHSYVGDPQWGLFLWVVSKITWVLASTTSTAVCLGGIFQ